MTTLCDAARRDWNLLQHPVRIVVPTLSLRNHFSRALIRRLGALAGFQVTTLYSLALDLVRAGGDHPGRGTALLRVLVRRFARLEEPLHDRLADLTGGYDVVTRVVRDFLDAGFDSTSHEVLTEYLEAEASNQASSDEIARARSLLNVTAAVQQALEVLELSHSSAVLRGARRTLEAGHDTTPPPIRELLVHGFSEASGVMADLLEALLRTYGGTLYLDHPPTLTGGHETAHPDRLAVRLSQVARVRPTPPSPSSPGTSTPPICFLSASDPNSEVRAMAQRIRQLLDGGATAEDIGLVSRDLRRHGVLLRRHFAALGIPFSAVRAPGPLGKTGRDLAVLRDILRHGPTLAIERWLDGLKRRIPGPKETLELTPELCSKARLAFFARGASRLTDLARIQAHSKTDILQTNILQTDILQTDILQTDVLQTDVLQALAQAGRSLTEELVSWQQISDLTVADHERQLLRVLDHHLGWTAETLTARTVVDSTLDSLDVPRDLHLSHNEFVLVILEGLESRAGEPLGGRGGGVQVLGASETRGLTFDHLFLFGATRDSFPRPVTGDPLLPDRVRRGLARLLPDLPIRAALFDAERHLFAQLLSSASHLTLSWHEEDGTGHTTSISPLVERLERHQGDGVRERAPRCLNSATSQIPAPVPETLLRAALHGDRQTFARILPLAVEDLSFKDQTTHDLSFEDQTPLWPQSLAKGRLAVLEELDPDRSQRQGRRLSHQLGPYFGFLGPTRAADPFITSLENLAACPWQTFLRRRLRVHPMPDPLASLPSLRGLLVGRLVHRVLERLTSQTLNNPDLSRQRRGGEGLPVPWPKPDELEAVLLTEARSVLAEQGLGLKGLARAAIELARPYLDVARRLDWPTGHTPSTRSVESTETVTIPDRRGRPRTVRFQADRVDQAPGRVDQAPGQSEELLYTDYKTGALRKTRRDVREHLLAWIEQGEWLQAAAYAHGDNPPRAGRYVFLRPDLADDERVLRIESGDRELGLAFTRTVGTLLDTWDRGLFFPRLVEPDEDVEPPRCRHCEVAQACLRRDSGARGRLRKWTETHLTETHLTETHPAETHPAEHNMELAFLRTWWLRGNPPG